VRERLHSYFLVGAVLKFDFWLAINETLPNGNQWKGSHEVTDTPIHDTNYVFLRRPSRALSDLSTLRMSTTSSWVSDFTCFRLCPKIISTEKIQYMRNIPCGCTVMLTMAWDNYIISDINIIY
jgi:hypothetical protein